MDGVASSRRIIRCVLFAGIGLAWIRADTITITLITAQRDVIEGNTLNLDFQITNSSKAAITITDLAGVDGFVDPYTITGGLPDPSDSLLQTVQSARSTKPPNNTLAAGDSFTYLVSLQTPNPNDDPKEENNDFGEWMLKASGPTIVDSAGDQASLSNVRVRVFDTPEPRMLIPIFVVCMVLVGYSYRGKRAA